MIHNSEEKKVVLTQRNGNKLDLNIKQDISLVEMKKYMKKHVQVHYSETAKDKMYEGNEIQYVDVWWPNENIPVSKVYP